MYTSLEAIIFYILLADSISALVIAYNAPKWYKKEFKILSRLFPMTKGWTALYFILVLFIGYLVFA